jgi:hypothetical protein
MNFKSLLKSTLSLMLVASLIVSCGDDGSTSTTPTAPSVSAPSAQNALVGSTIEVSFSVTASGGYASATATAENGSATISSQPSTGAASGNVVVNYTANAAGAGSVTVTVNDADGLSDDATAVVTVTEEETTIRVVDNITSDTTWETGKVYILGGRIAVEAGATLTIEGGTIVKGEAGTGANATALLVARDGTLNANGTADAPIIFTSFADEITPEQVAAGDFTSPNLDPDISGLWGGVIVLGNAPISASNEGGDINEVQIEGIPTSDANGLYGGNDANDSSGSITYISIRHGGSNIGEGNEINGLTLGGVGAGTVVENVEVVANQDDGVEWFGGTVDVSNVLVWNSGDDAIDTDQAWSGTVDNMLIVSPGDSPYELDGPEGSFNSTGHTITNATVFVSGNGAEEMIDVDDNTDVFMSNILLFGLAEGNIISSDYPEYAANENGYAITGIEVVLPEGSAVADFFPEGLIPEVTAAGSVGEATVGADVSVFGWTWARQSGALDDLGI